VKTAENRKIGNRETQAKPTERQEAERLANREATTAR